MAEKFRTWLKYDLVRYLIIFLMLAGVSYLVLNFGALYATISSKFEKKQPAPQTEGKVLGVSTPEYERWIRNYFYAVNNPDVISPNADFDRDGLSNYQEFLLHANPTKRSTIDNGIGDGQRVLNGQNPLTGNALTDEQKRIIKDWDLQEINNRLSYYAITSLKRPLAEPGSLIQESANVTPALIYDLSKSGEVLIPKLGARAPLIWSQSAEAFSSDLERGLIHYPGTSLPGQRGLGYISGHSSNYIWKDQTYAHVFARLNELEPGDEFFVSVYTAAGEKLDFRYVVVSKNKYQPDDPGQFTPLENVADRSLTGFTAADSQSWLNLSTCWPLGSTAKRYVVSGRLTGV